MFCSLCHQVSELFLLCVFLSRRCHAAHYVGFRDTYWGPVRTVTVITARCPATPMIAVWRKLAGTNAATAVAWPGTSLTWVVLCGCVCFGVYCVALFFTCLVCLCESEWVSLSLGPFFLSLRQTLHRLWVGHTLHSSPPTTTPPREIEMGEEEKQVTFRNGRRDERAKDIACYNKDWNRVS